ncbi:P-loop containing nucleoside triphosphate hydrolase protein [Cubamyces sp. BRFM 1775]|nr:P-loop containing nucleoside triphosphate hydrolase protein [Cubamyces sp. BRFM 1775]
MLFFRQFFALFLKNRIVLAKHPVVNLLRCLILPIAGGVFLAYAQVFLSKPSNNGLGSMIPVAPLADVFDGSLKLVWSDDTNGTGSPTPSDIMTRMTRDFSSKKLEAVLRVDTDRIGDVCQQNFNGVSGCFASVTFDHVPTAGSDGTLNYTIRGDQHLTFVDVIHHTSDFEVRILPLQWAVESAIIELDTGVTPATPLEWPFTQTTNEQDNSDIRISYINQVAKFLVIAFSVCFVSIAYHLAGAATAERASGLTSHMKAMGLLDSARVLSWHLTLSLAYLPSWIVIAVIWKVKIYTGTSVGILIGIHLLFGLSLASWSFLLMAPFGRSPQLAAIATTVFSFVWVVIGMSLQNVTTTAAAILTIFFPPFFYPVAIRCITEFETQFKPTSALHPTPLTNLTLWPLLLSAAISVFLWPWLGTLLECQLYDARNPSDGWRCWGRRARGSETYTLPQNVAISIRNLGKDFRPLVFKRKERLVTAISDLSLDIPKNGIFVLLGPNGAGKSTVMSVLGGLMGRTRGTVVFEGGLERPPRGSIGLVPQKNVLFSELTCYQTLRLWKAIKPRAEPAVGDEDVVRLLGDCDLGDKVHFNSGSLSGGQKRKLQLAIGLVGGSQIVLVDECTSGVDPLSRRAIWKTLTAVRNDRTIVFTTHFLDEADLLADDIAVLAAPGRLVAHGNPVALKTSLGDGYTLKVVYAASSSKARLPDPAHLLSLVCREAPQANYTVPGAADEVTYHLKTGDPGIVQRVLQLVERYRDSLQIASYSVSGASIEDIFLDLINDAERDPADAKKVDDPIAAVPDLPRTQAATALELSTGNQPSMLSQAFTIFHKRLLIARRSFFTPLLALFVVLVASCLPLHFVPKNGQACLVTTKELPLNQEYIGDALQFVIPGFEGADVLASPPGILQTLGNATFSRIQDIIEDIPDNATFISTIEQKFQSLFFGGISVDLASGRSLFAWNAQVSTPGLFFLNTVSNILYNKALNDTGKALTSPKLIAPMYGSFPEISAGNLIPLKWAGIFAAVMGIFPAFFTLYVAQERRSSVQAMQFSNGLSNPAGLWLGHIMFDSIIAIVAATVLVIVFAATSTLFRGLGFLWFIMVLYGFTGTLFAYCFSVVIASPLVAFGSMAIYQIIVVGLYIAGYMIAFTYPAVSHITRDTNIIHFTVAPLSPVLNVARAAFVSVNLFTLLCKGSEDVDTAGLGSITRFGGPILYLIVQGILLFLILVWVDSGAAWKPKLPSRHTLRRTPSTVPLTRLRADVSKEMEEVGRSGDALRVLNVSKTFGSNTVVDSVSFGVPQNTIFALLGPNGAGKTTTFNIIRGDLRPDRGDVLINGHSIVRHTQAARRFLGVCPQFTAIDTQLTVREHLYIYARLKGLRRGEEVQRNLDVVMHATGLLQYADRLASQLSGGNQRKLALAIALIGNPSVILIDEFSTGIDAKMKRDMWGTLKHVAVGKAIVITTHSMEEASTLANKVGILSKRMLAVGTTESLVERYATYLVHFPCRTREDVVRAQQIMARIPGARMADDVATRFEVPISSGKDKAGMTLADLFGILAESGVREYAVEQASLESVFMKLIKEDQVGEGEGEGRGRGQKWTV